MIPTFRCSLSYSSVRQTIANINHDRTVSSVSLVSDLGQIPAQSSISHVFFNPSKISPLSILLNQFTPILPSRWILTRLLFIRLDLFHYWACRQILPIIDLFFVDTCLSCCGGSWFLLRLRRFSQPPSASTQSSNPPDTWLLQPCVERNFVCCSSFWSADQWPHSELKSVVTSTSSSSWFTFSFLSLLFWFMLFSISQFLFSWLSPFLHVLGRPVIFNNSLSQDIKGPYFSFLSYPDSIALEHYYFSSFSNNLQFYCL